jgi:hypothetical protein
VFEDEVKPTQTLCIQQPETNSPQKSNSFDEHAATLSVPVGAGKSDFHISKAIGGIVYLSRPRFHTLCQLQLAITTRRTTLRWR